MEETEGQRFRAFAVYTIQWLDRTGQSNTFMREVTDLVLNYGHTVESAIERAKYLEKNAKAIQEFKDGWSP